MLRKVQRGHDWRDKSGDGGRAGSPMHVARTGTRDAAGCAAKGTLQGW